MAFKNFLHMIGLVDTAPENSVPEQPSENRERQSTYVPPRRNSSGQNSRGYENTRTYGGVSGGRGRTTYTPHSSSSSDMRGQRRNTDFTQEKNTFEEPRRSSRTMSDYSQQEEAPRTRQRQEAEPARRVSRPQRGTRMYPVATLSDTGSVIEDLVAGYTLLVTLQGLDMVTTQRVLDTLSGATFAVNGNLRKVSPDTYVLSPYGRDIEMGGVYR